MTPDRARRLRDHLMLGAASPFVWGARDCSLWVADWIAIETGRDPVARFRGTYSCARSCARALRREGGLPALASRIAVEAGLTETTAPSPGDVGVIETEHGPFMMLRTGHVWAWKTKTGVLFASAPALRAWAV
ncbi:DUF6950 family protein [Methylobacterium sp.]|uniref:DUF6950 family protein n=1 Tax=Methylobacterium sp. TaxID=409 RepID=UPI003B5AD914